MRSELIRDIGGALAQELSDAGFTVTGLPAAAAASLSGRPAGSGGGQAGGTGGGGTSGPVAVPVQLSFHLTSIYDHSVFEAMSRVVQKVTPGPSLMPPVENLLNALLASCGAEKVFLFDVVTKLYLATDSNPVQDAMYELCADMLDVVVDVSCIYDPLVAAPGQGGNAGVPAVRAPAEDSGRCSASFIRLSNGLVLYMREVAPYMALVALVKDDAAAGVGLDGSELDDGAFGGAGLEGAGGGMAHGGGMGGGDGSGAALPHSALSLTKGALVDRNMRVFASALREVFTGRPIISLPVTGGTAGSGGGAGAAASASGGGPGIELASAPGSARRRP